MITEKQFQEASAIIGCEVAAIKAVYEVEAAGHGYLPDGRVKILFEGHRFWKLLLKAGVNPSKYREGYENILYSSWDKKYYKGGAAEWERVSQAIEVCKKAGVDTIIALQAASYGSFQILGENAMLCGYFNAHEMLAAYNEKGEAEQLLSFCRFVKIKKLDKALREKNWPVFAEGYNGTGYRQNQYHIKLPNSYNRFK